MSFTDATAVETIHNTLIQLSDMCDAGAFDVDNLLRVYSTIQYQLLPQYLRQSLVNPLPMPVTPRTAPNSSIAIPVGATPMFTSPHVRDGISPQSFNGTPLQSPMLAASPVYNASSSSPAFLYPPESNASCVSNNSSAHVLASCVRFCQVREITFLLCSQQHISVGWTTACECYVCMDVATRPQAFSWLWAYDVVARVRVATADVLSASSINEGLFFSLSQFYHIMDIDCGIFFAECTYC